jgi:hypothetical protein
LWAGALVVIYVGAWLFAPMVASRRSAEELEVPGLEELGPLQFVGTVLLGGFRGVLVDVLWVKAMDYHRQEQFFDLYYTTTLILKVQPHIPHVWVFNAWNLAYNVSVKFLDPEDRWVWVERGLEMLGEGLKQNPRDLEITGELGFFYYHKVGGDPYYTEQVLDDPDAAIDWRGVVPDVLSDAVPEARYPYDIAAYWLTKTRECPDRQGTYLTRFALESLVRRAYQERAEELISKGLPDGPYSEALVQARAYAEAFKEEVYVLRERHPDSPIDYAGNIEIDYKGLIRRIDEAEGRIAR